VADDKSSIPQLNDNVGLASSEKVDRDQGLCYVIVVSLRKLPVPQFILVE